MPTGIYFYTASAEEYISQENVRLEVYKETTIDVELQKSYEIVPFSSATDEQIEKLLNAHYNGFIDLSKIWKVGDTRKIHINAISADSNNVVSHVAQDMTFVILDFNHDDLVEQIGEKMKAAVTIQCREVLGNNGTSEQVYYWGDKHTSSDQDNYLNTPMRTWMNRNFIQALPTTLQPLIKEVIKKNLSTHKGYSIITTRDKAFWF